MKLNLVSGGQLDGGKFNQRRDKMDKHRDQKGVLTVRYSRFMDNVSEERK
jgi:hypothetical protein